MRNLRTQTWLGFVALALIISCGKNKGDNSAPSSVGEVRITKTENLGNGKSRVYFTTSTGDLSQVQCRSLLNGKSWQPSSAGFCESTTNDRILIRYSAQAAQYVSHNLAEGYEEIPLPAAEPAAQVESIAGIDGQLEFVGRRIFVPENLRLMSYASAAGIGKGFVQSITLQQNEHRLRQFVKPRECYGELIALQTSPLNNYIGSYCREYLEPAEYKQLTGYFEGLNRVELTSLPDPKGPFTYMSVTVINNTLDAQNTKKLYTTQCGAPNTTAGHMGFAKGSVQGIPLLHGYLPGSAMVPARVDWCRKQDGSVGVNGIANTYYIANFEVDRFGSASSDKLEVEMVLEANGMEPHQFIQAGTELIQTVLQRPSVPYSN